MRQRQLMRGVVLGLLLAWSPAWAQVSSLPAIDTVMDEGTALGKERKLNFSGSGISCTRNTGLRRIDCTVTAGGSAAGAAGAVQSSNGSGGLSDSGVTASAGVITASELNLTGGSVGGASLLAGTTPPAPTDANFHRYYFNIATGVLEAIATGGAIRTYLTTTDTQTVSGKTISGADNTIMLPGQQHWWVTALCNNATASPLFNLPPSNAPTPVCLTGTNQFRAAMRFADAATQSFYGSFVLPPTYDGTGIGWAHRYAMDAGTTGAVGICMRMVRVPAASNPDPAFAALSTGNCTSNTVPGTAGNHKVIVLGNQTCTSCVAGDLVMFVVTRDGPGSVVTDSATGNMDLLFTGPVYGHSH